MTTAHRPTWKAAVGQASEGGWAAGGAASAQRSVLDAPSHTKLKTRNYHKDHVSQEISTSEEVLKQSLKKLQSMEEQHRKKRSGGDAASLFQRDLDEKVEEEGRKKLLMATADVDDVELRNKYDDGDNDDDENTKGGNKAGGADVWSDSDLDASDSDEDSDDSDDSDDDSDDESEDEEAALQAELAKIRAEREKAKAKAEAAAQKQQQEEAEEAALIGNPLLNGTASDPLLASGKMKRKWNDDVVFRNQARGEPDQNKKRFINDTVRNDFHKKFLNKFIR